MLLYHRESADILSLINDHNRNRKIYICLKFVWIELNFINPIMYIFILIRNSEIITDQIKIFSHSFDIDALTI